MNHLFANWKTTVQSILTAIIGISAVTPSLSVLTPKQAAFLVSIGAVAKVILGLFQQDAGTTEAKTRSGEVKSVPSHEIPNDPTATPVAKL